MKIISKFKDYYDYLVSVYGLDEVMVYDRRTDYLEKPSITSDDRSYHYKIAICGQFYNIYLYKDKFYYTVDELVVLDKLLKKNRKETIVHYHWNEKDPVKTTQRHFDETNKTTDINIRLRQPVVIKSYYGKMDVTKVDDNSDRYYTFFDTNKKVTSSWNMCNLTEFGLATYVPADEMYQKIYAFISWLKDHPEIPNKQSNEEKLLSHGFDKKSSFRHRK